MFGRVIDAYRVAASGLPRRVWILCLVMLVNRAGTMILPFLTLYLTLERGFGLIEAGRLVGLYGLGALAGGWIGGSASDRLGPIRTMKLSLAGSGVAFLAVMTAGPLWLLSLVLFSASVISEAVRPAVMTLCAELSPPGLEARSFALLRLAANIGMSLGPAVGGLLAVYSYNWIFIGDALTCWLALILVQRYLWVSADAKDDTGSGEEAATAVSGSPWADGPFLLLMVWVVFYALAIFQIFSTLPLFLKQEYGFREDRIGLVLGWNAALIVVFEMLLVQRLRNVDPIRLIAVGGLLTCAGFAVLPLGQSMAIAMIATAVWTVGEMLALPFLNVIVASRAGKRHRGRYMGMYTMSFASAFTLAPLTGTWMLDRFGSAALWYSCGALGVFLALGALALRRPLGYLGNKPAE